MFNRQRILIVEDDIILGLCLVTAIEDGRGEVVGPIPTVEEALKLAEERSFSGAILDANLADRNVTPLALALLEKGIPFLVYTGVGLPEELSAAYPHMSFVMKPMSPEAVVRHLFEQIEGAAHLQTRMPFAISNDDEPSAVGAERDRKIDMISSALFGQFSVKAILVAERQMAAAEGDALATWRAITERLKAMSAPIQG